MKPRRVLLLDTQPVTHNYYITLAIADALRQSRYVEHVVLATHADAVRRCQDEALDTFVAFGGSETHTAMLARLCGLADLSILWTTEDPYQLAGNIKTSTCFDLVFSNDKASVEAYGGRAHHLPLAASALFQDHAVADRDGHYLYDLLFIGTAWPNRVRSLNAILDRVGDLKAKIALPWNEFIGPPDLIDENMIIDWRCGNSDFARFANRSRITLTLPRHFSAASTAHVVGSTPPPRLFETGLAGGFQVIVSPEPETADYYEPGREIITCNDDEAAVEAIARMLKEPAQRMAIAGRARTRTQQEHLYTHRVDRMLDIALGAPRSRRYRPVANPKKVVLFVSHNRLGCLPGGGVEIYQELIADHLDDVEVVFFYPTIRGGQTFLRIDCGKSTREIEIAPMSSERISNSHIEGIFAETILEYKVDLIHFHHLLYLPLSFPLISRALGVPSVWQMHDYFLICDRYNLLTRDRQFCDVVERGSAQCDACLLALDGRLAGAKARRDGVMTFVARSFDAIVASTPYSGDYLARFFPEVDRQRIHILPLPAMTPASHRAAQVRTKEQDEDRLVVAIPGNFTTIKGGDDVLDVIALSADHDIAFEVFGRVEDRLRDRLMSLGRERVTLHMGYDHKQIVEMLAGCDVSLHLSIWPETFMLSLSEAWEAGLVPIVTDLGAPGERVQDGVDGYKVPPRDPTAVVDLLLHLNFDRSILRRMAQVVAAKGRLEVEEHVETLRGHYKDLIAARPTSHSLVPDHIRSSTPLTLFDCGLRFNSSRWTTRTNLWDNQQEAEAPIVVPVNYAPVRNLSDEERLLPITTPSGGDEDHRMLVDHLEVDGRQVHPRNRVTGTRDLAIEGWMVAGNGFEAQHTYLRLRGTDHSETVLLESVERSDLGSDVFENTSTAGFRGSIDLGRLPEDLYDVDLLQPGHDIMLVYPAITRVAVQHFDSRRPPRWTARPAAGPTPVVRSDIEAPFRLRRQNLDVLFGTCVGRTGDVWWCKGEISDLIGRTAPLFAVLHDQVQGDLLYHLPADVGNAGLPDEPATVTFMGMLDDVPVGNYSLFLLTMMRRGPDEMVDTGLRLCVSPAIGRFFWSTTATPALDAPVRDDADLAHSLEEVLPVGSDESASGRLLMCRGWSFAPDLGPPICTVFRWRQDGTDCFAICEPLARTDVRDSFGVEDATATGFEGCIPQHALEAGQVRFLQCYPEGVVEWVGFDRMLREQLPASSSDDVAGPSP